MISNRYSRYYKNTTGMFRPDIITTAHCELQNPDSEYVFRKHERFDLGDLDCGFKSCCRTNPRPNYRNDFAGSKGDSMIPKG